jgi:serine/threonine protein phosphatase 1
VLSPLSGIERLRTLGRSPSLPPGIRIYAIGDIHGRCDLLNELLTRTDADIKSRPAAKALYVFLGDYIDRGPKSRETIDRLIEHSSKTESVLLKGNHELVAIRCLSEGRLFDQWMRIGGAETLISYGIAPGPFANGKRIAQLQAAFHGALPSAHLRFFRDLQTSFTCGDFFFAHAGVKPKMELALQSESDLLWIREQFLNSREDFGKIVVHGHTPNREIDVEPNRINIDTGAFATGRLTCLVMEDATLSFIDTT